MKLKTFLINLIAIIFLLSIILVIILSCNYIEKGEIYKVIPLGIVLLINLAIIFIIAHINDNKIKKEKRAKQIAQKRAYLKAKEEESAKRSCILTASESYTSYESLDSYEERLKKQEDRALWLTKVNLQELI